MTKGLRIASDLVLPLNAVTEPVGMFANRGKGKSNGAHRIVEELYAAGLPAIVLDVKGDWYGIRSSADGTAAGLPFLILGGSHGDIPLEPGSGVQWARFLAEHRIPTIVDLSGFSKTQARRWVMEFAEELYRVNTEPLMLVVDEADVLVPQRLAADLFRLLGAMEDIAKRGRQRGLGILIISQRVADVNKSVTDLLETLLLFGITGTRTRKAILDWIDDHADPEEAKAVVATLSSLEPGECWVWSPAWLRILRRVRLLRPVTFDSHATPEPGQRRRPIKTMADIDLTAVRDTMAATIERAAATDPKALQARVRALEALIQGYQVGERSLCQERDDALDLLDQARADLEVHRQIAAVEIEVPVLDLDLVVRLEEALSPWTGLLGEVQDRLAWEVETRDNMIEMRRKLAADAIPAPPLPDRIVREHRVTADGSLQDMSRRVPRAGQHVEPTPTPLRNRIPMPTGPAPARAPGADNAAGRIMNALSHHPAGLTAGRVAALAGISRRKSTFRNALSTLRTSGYLQGSTDGVLLATPAGLAEYPATEMPTGEELLHYWHGEVGDGAPWTFLGILIDAWPTTLSQPDVAKRAGMDDATKSTVRNGISKLRTLGLIVGTSAALKADDDLMAAL